MRYNLFENHFQQLKTITKKQLNFERKNLMYLLIIPSYCNRKKIIILNLQMIKSKQTNSLEILKKETNLSNKTNMRKLSRNLKQKLKKLTRTLRHQDANLTINLKSKHRSLIKRKSFFLSEKVY